MTKVKKMATLSIFAMAAFLAHNIEIVLPSIRIDSADERAILAMLIFMMAAIAAIIYNDKSQMAEIEEFHNSKEFLIFLWLIHIIVLALLHLGGSHFTAICAVSSAVLAFHSAKCETSLLVGAIISGIEIFSYSIFEGDAWPFLWSGIANIAGFIAGDIFFNKTLSS